MSPLQISKMKPGEQMAYEYFVSKGYTNIVYEPNRNQPPDFVIDGKIAVEVTRLSQFVQSPNGFERLEDLEFNLMTRFLALLKTYQNIKTLNSCFVSLDYRRPLFPDKSLIKEIKTILDAHLNEMEIARNYQVKENLLLRIRPTKLRLNRPFSLSSRSDNDGGGFVIHNILESLKIILPQKEKKVLQYRDRYSVWWLALNDRIGWGLDEIDIMQLKEVFQIQTFFQKLIFISPLDSSNGMEMSISS